MRKPFAEIKRLNEKILNNFAEFAGKINCNEIIGR